MEPQQEVLLQTTRIRITRVRLDLVVLLLTQEQEVPEILEESF